MKQFTLYRNTKSRCDFEQEENVMNKMYDDAEIIDFEEFDANCEYAEIAEQLGYDEDLSLEEDWHVEYDKSKFGGLPCYFLRHSECDFIFLQPKDAEMLIEYHGKDANKVHDLNWQRHTQYGKGAVDPS